MPINVFSKPHAENKLGVGMLVEYEQHGSSTVAYITGERRGKWTLLGEKAQELELTSDRLYLLSPRAISLGDTNAEKVSRLQQISSQAQELAAKADLGEVWALLKDEPGEHTTAEIAEILFPKSGLVELLAARRALQQDTLYFKRRKLGFEPRPEETVEELKRQAEAERKKREERSALIETLVSKLKGQATDLPVSIRHLQELAAIGSQAENAKEWTSVVDEVIERCHLEIKGRAEEKAFALLVALGVFSPDEDLAPFRYKRTKSFSTAVMAEVKSIASRNILPLAGDVRGAVTIDSASTRDIDDALSLEEYEGCYRLGIHISDVASFIPEDSALEKEALSRASTVYCPDYQIPMLPPQLSEGALSLFEGERRSVMSFVLTLDQELNVTKREISRTSLVVSKRLSYDEVDAILYSHEANDHQYQSLLTKLWDIACAFEKKRIERGAIQFSRRELIAKVDNGIVRIEETDEETPARKLVSELMIAANETAALFARDRGFSLIFRGQEAPGVEISGQGLHIAEGPAREYFLRGLMKRSTISTTAQTHFGLGVDAYTHCTSPIRRFIDLVNQRQISHYLEQRSPLYSAPQILELAAMAESSLDEVNFIQRSRNRYWLMKYLSQEQLREVEAVIVRVDTPKPLAEVEIIYSIFPFQPLRPVTDPTQKSKTRLGEKIRLRLVEVNPRKDQIVLSEVE